MFNKLTCCDICESLTVLLSCMNKTKAVNGRFGFPSSVSFCYRNKNINIIYYVSKFLDFSIKYRYKYLFKLTFF